MAKNYKEFMEQADLIPEKELDERSVEGNYVTYLWDNYEIPEIKKRIQSLLDNGCYLYTVVQSTEGDDLYIWQGSHAVNRIGYLISKNEVDIENNDKMILI